MNTIYKILEQYWGYNKFRPLQEDIINSVLLGNDTLALLPTGGGKSICFQVPAMAKEGKCLVVSPLIALMKDQVENLQKRGIKAAAIYSGLHNIEIEKIINQAVYSDLKFLYVSPERLQSEKFIANLDRMNISILAIDEAHCISQWGYDFRPPYLQIAEIRKYIPQANIIALTATATPEVVIDIQEKLEFKKPNLFQKSFERSNLTYFVIKEEDKLNRLIRILNKVPGCGVVYVRNRRKTFEIAQFLHKNGISADFYHAGLSNAERDKKQQNWLNNTKRIIVATNAFGMGIDKPDVRVVVHLDIPDNIEAYFQEAGRGGRDEKNAWAIILFENADIIELEKNFQNSFPSINEIKNIYNALTNWFQIPVGAGKGSSYDFDLSAFAKNYNFQPIVALNSLKFIEKQGAIMITEDINQASKMFISCPHEAFYAFQVANKSYDKFIKLLLRSYTGLFNDFVKINEDDIAKNLKITKPDVVKILQKLEKYNLIAYSPQNNKPKIIFLEEAIDSKDFMLDDDKYEKLKNVARNRLNSMLSYINSVTKCRSKILLSYFGQNETKRCGKCDVCIKRNKLDLNEYEFDSIVETLKPILKEKPYLLDEIITKFDHLSDQKVIKVIQWLIDNNKMKYNQQNKLVWV